MKKVILLVLLLSLSVSGCGFKDLDKRFFVVSVGVDKAKESGKRYRVILKLAIPSATITPGKENFQIIWEEADSLSEAIRIIKSKVDKELDFAHAKVFIFGESIAKQDIKETIDWFVRRRDIQMISWLGVGRPDAQTVLEVKPPSERLPSNTLFLSFGKVGTESAYTVTEYLFDFYRRLNEQGLDPYMPVIEARKDFLEINTAALFDKDGMKLILSPRETRLFHEMYQSFSKVDIKIELDKHKYFLAAETIKVTFDLSESSMKNQVAVVRVRVNGIMEESEEILTHQKILELEKAANESLTSKYLHLLKKLQKAKLDPIGLGDRFMASHYNGDKDWETWQQLYPNLQFRIEAQVNIESSGVVK